MGQRVAPGRRIGPYELKEEIGRGGSAVVFRALHDHLGREVAIKVIAAGFAADATFQARFRQEADLISRLDHPNVLRVLDSGETGPDDQLLFGALAYLVTEYMPGGSLAQQIKRERSRQQRCTLALTVAQHIGAALDYAHASGVLHRDIKPSNVFVDGDGRFVLGDFGLARVLHSGDASLHLTATGLVAGTPAYMAPEQALGESADSRTDLYGLAVVLYQIITGRVPFEAETPLATMLAHVHQPPPSPREVAPETPLAVEAVLLRALAKVRDERYASGDELARALRAAVLAAYGPDSVVAVSPEMYRSAPATVNAGPLHHSSAKSALAARRPRPRRRLPKAARLLLAGAGALATVSSLGVGAAAYALGPGRAPLAAFAERFALSSTEPTWTDAWPKQGAANQSLQTSISVRFSHDMDRASVESAIVLSPELPVSFSWDRRAVTLTPLEEMQEGTEYVLFLDHTRAVGADGRALSRPLIRRFTTLALPQPPAAPAPSIGSAPAPAPANNTGGPASLIPIFPIQPTPERVRSDSQNVTRPPQAPSPTVQPLPTFAAPIYAPPTAPAQPPDTSMVAGLVVSADDDGLEAAMQMTPASTTTPVPNPGLTPTATPVVGTTPVPTAPTYPNGISLVNVPPPVATPAPGLATPTTSGGATPATPSGTSGTAGQLDTTAPTATATRSRTASQTPVVSATATTITGAVSDQSPAGATATAVPTQSPAAGSTGTTARLQSSPTSTTAARIIASATATGTPISA